MILHVLLFLAMPVLFPYLHPLAVWIGVGSVALAGALMWRGDDFSNGNVSRLERQDEAAQWLRCMEKVRVG